MVPELMLLLVFTTVLVFWLMLVIVPEFTLLLL